MVKKYYEHTDFLDKGMVKLDFPECKIECGKKYKSTGGYGNKIILVSEKPCVCKALENYKMDLYRSDLHDYFNYRLKEYKPKNDKQKKAHDKYSKYVENFWDIKKSVFLSGYYGSGKTDLACRIGRELAGIGVNVKYVRYMNYIQKAQSLRFETYDYDFYLKSLVAPEVLILDDVFKVAKSDNKLITTDSIDKVYDLIDRRYANKKRVTIFTSEFDINQLISIDEALGSRIDEMSLGYWMDLGDKNLRMKE